MGATILQRAPDEFSGIFFIIDNKYPNPIKPRLGASLIAWRGSNSFAGAFLDRQRHDEGSAQPTASAQPATGGAS